MRRSPTASSKFLSLSQVEFESVKRALSCREEELVLAGTQLLELGRLRDLAEHQLQEALEALQAEREQKQELRRELAIYTAGRHDSLNSLQTNLEELNHSHAECEEQDSGFTNGSSIGGTASTPRGVHPAPGLVADLFSELSLAEIHKLQQQLLQVSCWRRVAFCMGKSVLGSKERLSFRETEF